ncbi:MAG TPA: MarR family transcriptional regulator [Acidobacteriaceae bacterium]|nr:MarR family transcriptional regulator [Acidobacteriaceae bacterium]
MNERGFVAIPRLLELAEFRFQLRKFLRFSEIAAEAAGISVQQYQMLQVIAAVPEGQGASISYLADRMILRHNSAVELVDRAVRAGMVRRESDDEDLRRSIVRLMPEGEKALEQLIPSHLHELDVRGGEIIAALKVLLESGENDAVANVVGDTA